MKRFNWQNWAWSLCAALTLGTQTAQAAAPAVKLDWHTFLGGTRDDVANAITLDAGGYLYVAGSTFSTNWISGGFATEYVGSRDAFVVKMDAAGAVQWSTYLGASSDDQIMGLAIGPDGNIYAVGNTRSRGWALNGFDTTYNDNGKQDAFVAKISPSGEHLWSTLVGGNDFEYGWAIVVDSQNHILITGSTKSAGWVRGGANTKYAGNQDAFVAMLSPVNGSNIWSTYLGGKELEAGRAIALDHDGNILVTGETASKGWVRGGAVTNYQDKLDAFVAKLSPTNGATLWSSYLGGKNADQSTGIAVDSVNNILVCGFTTSSNWISGGFSTSLNGAQDAFVAKLAPNSTPVWSTYLGGLSADSATAIAVDSGDNVLLTGETYSYDWVSGGFDLLLNGGRDAFVAKLSSTGGQLWSTCLGGESSESGAAIAVNASGIFVAGFSTSTNWVNTLGTTNHGGGDVLVAKLSEPAPSPCTTLDTPSITSSCGTSNSPIPNAVWNPSISWSGVPNASSYVVRLFMARSNVIFPVYVSPLIQPPTTSFTLPGYVLFNHQLYAWSVQALGDNGITYCDSPESGLCWFTNNISDSSRPTVNITTPANNARFTNTTVTDIPVVGTASDNVALAGVFWSVQYGVPPTVSSPTNQQMWHLALTANDWRNWTAVVPLVPGTNTIFTYSEDTAGNVSPIVNRTFYYVVRSPLTLLTNGSGTISRKGFTANDLEVGRAYTVTAKPNSKNLFLNWTGASDSGTFTTNRSSFTFVMQTNLTLTANFVPDPFPALKGTYNGLVFAPDGGMTNSGFFTLDLTDKGSFSGKLRIDGETLPFSGAFNAGLDPLWLSVIWSPVTPAHFGSEPLLMKLVLDPVAQTIDGTVHYNTWWGWETPLQSHRAVPTNAFAGSYTMRINGAADAAEGPAGHGTATVKIDNLAKVTLTGTLADGTPFTQATTASAYPGGSALWPCYVSLYNGKGVVAGWMGTNAPILPVWAKLPVPNARYYSNGFNVANGGVVARYVAPSSGANALNWTNGRVTIGGGNLATPLQSTIVVANNQVSVNGGDISNLTLTISAQTGTFTGSFTAPGASAKTMVKGALDQLNNIGAGWFLGTNQSGFILLEAQ